MSDLVPLVYNPLPLGAIVPTMGSWIHSELSISGNALAGRQYDFYSWVSDSSWLGKGSEYSSLNEGLPYWFNGIVPMAYLLNDDRLKSQVHASADYILSHQSDDGWIGPETGDARLFWARFPFILGLTNLADADPDWTDRIVDSLHRFNSLMNSMLNNDGDGYLFRTGTPYSETDYVWGRIRYQDMMISLMWLLENHPNDAEESINQNLQILHDGAIKWEDYWVDGVFITESLYSVGDNVIDNQYAYTHGVNVAQGLKSAAVARRFTHNESLVQTQFNGVDWTWQYHGAISGGIIADEILDGLEPYAGTELCGVVESIFSLSYLYQALGRSSDADRAELAAYSALPAMVTPDWWAREYLTQTNQPLAVDFGPDHNPFRADGPYSNVYGLEPNYPCCTVNHPQGLPKFIMGSYVKNSDNGLVHALLGPTSVSTQLQGGSVKIECVTSYPFGDTLSYKINADHAFEFYIRQPEWAEGYQFSNNSPQSDEDSDTGLIRLSVPAGTTAFNFTLKASIRTVPRSNDAVAVYRGAVLYALPVSMDAESGPPTHYSDQTPLADGSYPNGVGDYKYTNTSAWNIAIDTTTFVYHPSGSLQSPLFQENGTGNYITATGCEIDWPLWKGMTAGAIPPKDGRQCLGDKREIYLVPYGSAKLHMAELPTL